MSGTPHKSERNTTRLLAGLLCCWLFGCAKASKAPVPEAPNSQRAPQARTQQPVSSAPLTRKDDTVETHFGVRVQDPYRWLEDGDSEEVQAWIAAQNQRTDAALRATGLVAPLRQRLAQLLEIGSVSLPDVRRTAQGNLRLFYERREGKQNQPVLLWRDTDQGTDSILLDVNQLSKEGTIALDYFQPSPQGNVVAYGLSHNGSENSTLYVREVANGRDLDDVIANTRYASVCWQADERGFFYTRYPELGSVPAGEEQYHRKLFEHRLGTAPEQDSLVFGEQLAMTDYPSCSITPDGRYLMVSVHKGWNRSDLYLADTRSRPLEFTELTTGLEHSYAVYTHESSFFVLTNEGAPRYALYEVSPKSPTRAHWRRVLPEHETDVLDHVGIFADTLVASYSHATISRLESFTHQGLSLGSTELPEAGSVDGLSGVHDSNTGYFAFESFRSPQSIYRLEAKKQQAAKLLSVSGAPKPESLQVVRASAVSKDGTTVPYTIVARHDLKLDAGGLPTLLYGYGGFNISLKPRFSRTTFAFIEAGGVYVQANLRGGGEFGEAWHRQGQREHKQNVFDDFYAVAESLIATGVTSAERLAIYGRSNGGLLVAAAITQRPELFRAAVSAVPLTDMLRYPRFLLARLWEPEYGSPNNADDFKWLYAYSPYHQVKLGTDYPAVLLMTAETDTRVDPAHARKMAARLQAATSSQNPILLRSETKAGHGAGKPIQKVADEYAELYAFIMGQLSMQPFGRK